MQIGRPPNPGALSLGLDSLQKALVLASSSDPISSGQRGREGLKKRREETAVEGLSFLAGRSFAVSQGSFFILYG